MSYFKSVAGQEKTGPDLKISVLGDSLTTGFYLSRYLPSIWRARTKYLSNWFFDDESVVDSVVGRCGLLGNTTAYNFSRSSAHVDECAIKSKLIGKAMGVRHFAEQVDGLLSLHRFPDITLLGSNITMSIGWSRSILNMVTMLNRVWRNWLRVLQRLIAVN